MTFVLVAFWGSIVAAVILLVRSHGHRHEVTHGPADATAALRILDDRLARGDIDADEYRRRRGLLSP